MINKEIINMYVAINHKYDNPIIPELPNVILGHILKNPNKFQLYMDAEVRADLLIAYLYAKSYGDFTSSKEPFNMLNEVIDYVENKKWKK